MRNEKAPRSITSGFPGLFRLTHKAKLAFICASSVGIFAASANARTDVTWQTPATISGKSDVSTMGIYFGSWAPQDGGANNFRSMA